MKIIAGELIHDDTVRFGPSRSPSRNQTCDQTRKTMSEAATRLRGVANEASLVGFLLFFGGAPEFLEFILATDLMGKGYDSHWVPYWRYCSPCSVDYHVVGKLETAADDFRVSPTTLELNTNHVRHLLTTCVTKTRWHRLLVCVANLIQINFQIIQLDKILYMA